MKKFLSALVAAFYAAGFCFCQDNLDHYAKGLSTLMNVKPYLKSYSDEGETWQSINDEIKDKDGYTILQRALISQNEAASLYLLNDYFGESQSEFLKEDIPLNGKNVSILDLAENSGSKEVCSKVYNLCWKSVSYEHFKDYIGKHEVFLKFIINNLKEHDAYTNDGNEFLRGCMRHGNLNGLKYLVSNGLDLSKINSLDRFCYDRGFEIDVPLETKKQILDYIIENGKDLKRDDPKHPLIETLFGRVEDLDTFIYLLEKGMSVKNADEPLHNTFSHFDIKGDEKGIYTISLLIKNGVNIKNSWKAIEDACYCDIGDGKLVQFIIDNGAKLPMDEYNPKIQDDRPLTVVLYKGNISALKILYKAKADFKQERILLYGLADDCKSWECADFYLEKSGFNAMTKTSRGITAFWQACESENDAMISYFLEKGADVNACDNEKGRNPLMAFFDYLSQCSTISPKIDVLNLILNCGIDLNKTDKNGKTALDYAKLAILKAEGKENKALREQAAALVQKKFENSGIKIKENIHDAVLNKDNKKLSELLKDPAIKKEINLADSNGLSAMDYAVQAKNYEAVKILMKNDAFLSKSIIKNAIISEDTNLLNVIFDNGANINMDLVTGTDIKSTAQYAERTPLYFALRKFKEVYGSEGGALITIINKKPNWSIKYKDHGFLWNLFEEYPSNTKIKIAKAAIDNGEDPFENNNEFIYRFLYSARYDDKEFIKYFLYKNDNYKKLIDENGNYIFSNRSESNYEMVEKIVFEKLLVGKTMTVTENLNLRQEARYEDVIIGTLKAGTKVQIKGLRYKEIIDGITAYWVDVFLPSDTITTKGAKLKAGTAGYCFSGYLK